MPDVRFPTPSGDLPGYLAVPAGAGPWPGVVVLHEAYGLTDDIRAWTDRFAGEGYLALAPDLFGWGNTMRCLVATFRAMLSGSGRAFDDVDAARAFLASYDGASGKVGVIGFCMGGGFALAAAPRLEFAAASVNYGQVPKDAERALAGTCPLVGSYGGRDRYLPGRPAQRLRSALTTLGVDHDVKEYPDASHSFLNHHTGWMAALDRIGGTGFHGPSADDAWQRILAFFARHLR